MKKLFLFLFFVSNVVCAEEWLEAPNKLGGKILLLQSKCSSKADETGRTVIGTGGTGKNIMGCWYYFSDMVHVVWEDGSTYSYPKEIFYIKQKP